MKKIELAPLFRRIVAASMDALLAFFIYFILVVYVSTPIARSSSSYDKYVSDIYQYDVASHLFVWEQQDDSSRYNPIEVKDFTEKLNDEYLQKVEEVRNVDSYTLDEKIVHLQYYYTVYLTGDLTRVELPNNTETKTYDPIKDRFVSPNFDKIIDGKLPKDIYTNIYFNTKIMGLNPEGEENTSPYFAYPVKDEIINYEGIPVLKDGVNSDDAIKKVNELLYQASKEFFYSDYISELQNNVKNIDTSVMSINQKFDESDSDSDEIGDVLANQKTDSILDIMIHQEDIQMVRNALKKLDERDRIILSMRYGLLNNEMATLEKVSSVVGKTRERCRQLEKEALKKLQKLIEEELKKEA